MTPPFRHHRLAELAELLTVCDGALRAHASTAWDARQLTAGFLQSAAGTYEALGMGLAQNEALALTAELAAARRGVRPPEGGAGPARQRDLELSVALHVLTQAAHRLRGEVAADRDHLDAARDQLVRMVVFALENGVVDEAAVTADEGSSTAETVWRTLLAAPGTRSAARQLALTVATADVVLLLVDLLATLRAAVRQASPDGVAAAAAAREASR